MKLLHMLRKDIRVVFERDPAAKSVLEVVLCYQGLHAIWLYRIAHWFYCRNFILIPRLISNFARFLTGIEIHPGATIGPGLFIDHGTGIVIGETAELGRNVTLYQGVTLGGTGKEKGKRHPTIGNNVVVSTGAKILGSFTVGNHAKIGAGSVVLKEVPAYATVVGIPGRVVLMRGKRVNDPTLSNEVIKNKTMSAAMKKEMVEELDVDLAHDKLPDPELDMIKALLEKVKNLEEKVIKLEKEVNTKNAKSI
ncbi:serine O-acetyltransferase [Pectinatus cerevisiiphilus]|uniref:Serine acetyltransferase n=1 Tax=Pectinatus cerevisiiphilus TaxID=86956 RepID=A0A4R3K423_9FIRM|nr:serine O-acetyltransferase [Pectinatus cerevisiiphilus]TCS77498.1 serine O-acetyltransferase [Pectinatus cerevisiiphilus]